MNLARFTQFVVAILLLVAVAACGGKSSEPASESSESKEEKPQETFTLKYNTAYPPSEFDWDPKYQLTERFAELVEERTDGRVKIEIYFTNQLAGQVESLDALAKGTIDIQNLTPSAWGDKIPEGDISALAYWDISEEHALYIMRETEVGEIYENALENYGVKLLGYWPASATGIMSSTKIEKAEDFNGLVMNVTSSLSNDFYKSIGAGIATIPFAEQYEALMRGTIDVIQFPYYSLETYKLHEVLDYLTVPPTVSPSLGLVAISQKALDKMPEDLQEIILETAKEMEIAGIEGSKKLTERALKFAEENGVEIVKMTEKNYKEFTELNREKVWSKFAEKNENTKRMIEVLEEETEKWKKDNPEAVEKFNEYLAD